MTPRNIRRAAERQAAKQARKAERNAPVAPNKVPASPAQIAANHANAQHSTGPKTDAGKKTSSMNALKTGLTGRTIVLPTDDLVAYDALLNRLKTAHQPANEDELALVQSLVDTTWRLERIVRIEFTLYATGASELADKFADEFNDLAPADRAARIQMETHLMHEKTLRSLNTQEARLRRILQKDTAELKRLQAERQQEETEAQASIAVPAPAVSKIGFVFENFETPAETDPATPEITQNIALAAQSE